MNKKAAWRATHKWVGLVFTIFVLVFCISGIVLNHRRAVSTCEVSRSLLPSGYHVQQWNNGVLKGVRQLPNGRRLIYGTAGVWADTTAMNEGLDRGNDNRRIQNIAVMPHGSAWSAGRYAAYELTGNEWTKRYECDERLSDITNRGDTLVLLSRSHVYTALPPYNRFEEHQLPKPEGYEPRFSLFKQVWLLHSGELFGRVGQTVVDCLGLVLIFLTLTGLWLFFTKRLGRRWTIKWHNKLGVKLIVLTLLLSITGLCLRPPFMIPLALTKTAPIPFSSLDSPNPWHDQLRALRWDGDRWLLSSSTGFYTLEDFDDVPTPLRPAPSISPMGINVWEREGSAWLVGSFKGMYRWDVEQGLVTDYFTGEEPKQQRGMPTASVLVSGYADGHVFTYREGNADFPTPMPQAMRSTPMSLWNVCLELHVGRPYSPFLGPISELWGFLAGLLLTLILLSGYVIRLRRRRRG